MLKYPPRGGTGNFYAVKKRFENNSIWEPEMIFFFLMGDGLQVPFTPQKYLLTRSCQQLSRQGPEPMAKEPNLRS